MNRRAMIKASLPTPITLAVLASVLLAVGGCRSDPAAPPARPPLEGAAIGGPFTLVDKSGSAVRWSDFAGKYRIVYFGYTFCPDACPLDVGVMMRGFAAFDKARPDLGAQVRPLFISIDPGRDTPAKVGEFAAAFSPRLTGLTGTPEQVAAAAKAFVVYYKRGADSAGGYLMDHSRVAFLMDKDGKPLAMLPVDLGPQAVTAELTKWVH